MGTAVRRAARSSATPGEIVAVVVTESRAAGADAAELVFVDYDPLAATPDPRRTLAGEVLLFPELGTNVVMHAGPEQPDESLFDGCEVVVSGTVVSQRLAPARSSRARRLRSSARTDG